MTEISKLYKGFQTVVPSEIRKKTKLDMNHVLEWDVLEDGRMIVTPKKQIGFLDLIGIVDFGKGSDAVKLKKSLYEEGEKK